MSSIDFKIARRNSLRLETDGVWDDLEREEDIVVPHKIKLNECQMLRRALGDEKMDVLPKACKISSTSGHKSFMSRLSHLGDTSDIAGRVSINECHHLSDALHMVKGGPTYLPQACGAMLAKEEADMKDKFERDNAQVYKRLARRNSWVAREDFPPTAT